MTHEAALVQLSPRKTQARKSAQHAIEYPASQRNFDHVANPETSKFVWFDSALLGREEYALRNRATFILVSDS
ncbi:hypothetical protein CLCR_06502 [Cladophialophora carrionii]|uniref:Uncharacterized protein n=1 Tax=Cladophialophora carrionii TaxID=86049 RepID=A0A1C1CA39_9EURO|nr:hypothetical protein CLCR_06502 [Cladophialophora carrionii]